MIRAINNLGDRLLGKLLPSTSASAWSCPGGEVGCSILDWLGGTLCTWGCACLADDYGRIIYTYVDYC
jgi:hypothetical protein